VLLAARLAPDIVALTRQVQIACDIAKNSVARLAAQEPPRFEDNETSIRAAARPDRARHRLPEERAGERARRGGDSDIKLPTGERTLEFKDSPLSAALGDSQRVLPRHDRVRHPASQRRGGSASATSSAPEALQSRASYDRASTATNMTNGDGYVINRRRFANRTRRKSRHPRRRAATLAEKGAL